MYMRIIATLLVTSLVSACNKIPESEEAKKVGNIPKQTIDKATTDVNKAIQQGAERTREADQKSEQKQ